MSTRFYRPELDVIRFFAFFAVFLHHGLPENLISSAYGAFQSACGFGVCLFFTLSAYLITTLLLKERAEAGSINLPSFYMRRILRIWPLYFAAITVSAAISLVHHTFHRGELWYLAALFMMGNAVMGPAHVTSAMHLWSISVEEQFYVFWPSCVKGISPRQLFTVAIILIVIANAALIRFGLLHADTNQRVWWNSLVQMESFAAGILLALHHYSRPATRRPLAIRLLCVLIAPAAWFSATYFFRVKGADVLAQGPVSLCIGYALVAASCALLIAALQGTDRWPKPMIYFGKVSYGLYVFQGVALSIAFRLLPQHLSIQLVVAFAVNVALASLSYTFFESPFLRLKQRYEVIKSRPVS